MEEVAAITPAPVAPVAPAPAEEPIKHEITSADTLRGLALKYNTTVDSIRKANNLFSGDSSRPLECITAKKTLVIPRQGGGEWHGSSTDPEVLKNVERRKMIRRFLSRIPSPPTPSHPPLCSEEEARSYLLMFDDNFDLALSNWMTDFEWEMQNKKDEEEKRRRRKEEGEERKRKEEEERRKKEGKKGFFESIIEVWNDDYGMEQKKSSGKYASENEENERQDTNNNNNNNKTNENEIDEIDRNKKSEEAIARTTRQQRMKKWREETDSKTDILLTDIDVSVSPRDSAGWSGKNLTRRKVAADGDM